MSGFLLALFMVTSVAMGESSARHGSPWKRAPFAERMPVVAKESTVRPSKPETGVTTTRPQHTWSELLNHFVESVARAKPVLNLRDQLSDFFRLLSDEDLVRLKKLHSQWLLVNGLIRSEQQKLEAFPGNGVVEKKLKNLKIEKYRLSQIMFSIYDNRLRQSGKDGGFILGKNHQDAPSLEEALSAERGMFQIRTFVRGGKDYTLSIREDGTVHILAANVLETKLVNNSFSASFVSPMLGDPREHQLANGDIVDEEKLKEVPVAVHSVRGLPGDSKFEVFLAKPGHSVAEATPLVGIHKLNEIVPDAKLTERDFAPFNRWSFTVSSGIR